MSELHPLRRKVSFIMRIGLHPDRHLLGDLQAVTLQADDLLRIVRQQADRFQPEVAEDLRAEAVFAQVHAVAKFYVRLHGVVALFLELVGLDFRAEADAPPFLAHVENHTATGFGNLPTRLVQLWPAIAAARAEHIAGKAL